MKPAEEKLVTDKLVSPTKNITCPICMEDVKQVIFKMLLCMTLKALQKT